ncbi:hypothetical protein [Orrella daihaiensis]|uniref:Uncharacterized protein n=1 Tax=Orrella daihaiensis TaxID=2782176 RepID=A0ABY4AKA4_9BURK|nr:hypothetical protein [Orrella daihaiensis]UOD50700.1 hypothetical protein DHf2319_01840 [Orrella daihaiensis]
MTIQQKDLERLKKDAVLSLELSANTKTNVTNAEITTFTQKLKTLASKKELIVIVTETGKR